MRERLFALDSAYLIPCAEVGAGRQTVGRQQLPMREGKFGCMIAGKCDCSGQGAGQHVRTGHEAQLEKDLSFEKPGPPEMLLSGSGPTGEWCHHIRHQHGEFKCP